MSGQPVLLVCGLGRCGTSLVMQMLAAGGIECAGEPPAFEGSFNAAETIRGSWLRTQRGRAVKLLDPHRCGPKIGRFPEAIVIWCDRNVLEQAKSQIKFATMLMGLPYDRGACNHGANESPEQRFQRVRAWVASQIVVKPEELLDARDIDEAQQESGE